MIIVHFLINPTTIILSYMILCHMTQGCHIKSLMLLTHIEQKNIFHILEQSRKVIIEIWKQKRCIVHREWIIEFQKRNYKLEVHMIVCALHYTYKWSGISKMWTTNKSHKCNTILNNSNIYKMFAPYSDEKQFSVSRSVNLANVNHEYKSLYWCFPKAKQKFCFTLFESKASCIPVVPIMYIFAVLYDLYDDMEFVCVCV